MFIVRVLFSLSLALAAVAAPLVASTAHAEEARPREIEIVVDRGYQPARIVVQQGERVRLKIVRRDYSPCAREIVFPSLGIRRELPVNEAVFVDLPALPAGEIEFHCGMNMLHGKIVVEARK
ncbi:MAG: cupredoxin domain-containing protein [Minicystis sp.]